MGWNIALIENTARVPLSKCEAVARKIVSEERDAFSGICADVYDDDFTDTAPAHRVLNLVFGDPANSAPSTLYFDSDGMEHMDYVTGNDAICAALARAGTKGRILFGSLEGDNRGQFWGVEFASGHYRRLKATTADLNWNIGTSIAG